MTTTDSAPRTAAGAMERLAARGGPHDIALFLAAEGCTGRTGDGDACPVSRYLSRFADGVVTVDGMAWMDPDGREHVSPEKVWEFVMLFDDGEFPELVENAVPVEGLL
jgi:hypothetical protein